MESSTHQQQPEMRVNAPPSDFDIHATPDFHETQEITEFQDEVPRQEADVTDSVNLPPEKDPFPDQSITSFLARPRIVQVIKWQATSPSGALLARLPFPDLLFESPTVWNKIQQYVYLHAGLKFAFRTNGTAYHYGQLLICWRPACLGRTIQVTGNTTSTPQTAYDNIISCSQYDHVLISPSNAQVVEMEVPYMAPLERIPLSAYSSNLTPSFYPRIFSNLGVLEVWCLTPLRATGAANDPPVTLTIYASFTNPQLSGFTHQQLTYVKPAIPLPSSTDIPSTLRYTGAIAQAGTGLLPSDSSQSDGGATEVDADESQCPIVFLPAKLSSSKYAQPSYPLSIGDGTDSSDVISFSLSSHLSDWSLFHTFNISSSDDVNKLLASWYNCPYNCRYGKIGSATMIAHTKLSYLASLFSLWRGPIEYRFDFIASKFHSTRVKISWLPPETLSVPSLSEAPDEWTKIIDIQGQISVTFTVPYLFSQPYISFDRNGASRVSNGTVAITLLNTVAYPTTPAPNITCNVWIRAPDISFAGYLSALSPQSVFTNGSSTVPTLVPNMFSDGESITGRTTEKPQVAQAGPSLSSVDLNSILHKPSLLGYVNSGGKIWMTPPFPEPLAISTLKSAALRNNTLLDYLAIIHVGFVGSIRISALNPSSEIVFAPRLGRLFQMQKEKSTTTIPNRFYSLRFNAASYFPASINALKDITLPCYTTMLYRPYSWYMYGDGAVNDYPICVPGIDVYNLSSSSCMLTLSASSDFRFIGKAPAPMLLDDS